VKPTSLPQSAKKMKTLGILFTLIASIGAQEFKLVSTWQNHQIMAVLEIADVANGVDATEARALAEAYFLKTSGVCGGISSMRREGSWWIFESLVGHACDEGVPIRIHAETGWVSKKGGGEIIRPPWTSLRTWFAGFAKARPDDETAIEGDPEQKPKNAEQGGADQPATAPESKSDGKDKPKLESE
jgi:hypothetical protein